MNQKEFFYSLYYNILVTQGRKEQIYFNNPVSYNMITKRNNFLLSGLRTYLAQQQQKKCNKCSAWFCKYLIISPSKQKENCKSHSNLHFLC